MRALPSIPVEAGLVASALRLLETVDELSEGATGVVHFGTDGLVLLESGRICWAVANPMRHRLTDILRRQSSPPLPRETVEAVYRRCRTTGLPLGEALVASGLVTERGLRCALFKHNGEAIAHLARLRAKPVTFVPHASASYDPTFTFSTCELLASFGALEDPAGASKAQADLEETLVSESSGVAFVRDREVAGAQVVAVARGCEARVGDLVAVCNFATGLFDVARTFDPTTTVARAVWGSRTAVVTWYVGDVWFVGLCTSMAAATRLVSVLARRAVSGAETGSLAPVSGSTAT